MNKELGKNSLDTLSKLGVEANAFTTNNLTAYLYEATDNFYEALDEFMDYVQNPYYTDENVEKERGIIEQEISMYDDEPTWAMYLNALQGMYHKNAVRIDVAGTKESIAKIDAKTLYTVYNNFYVPENMCIVVVGDFEQEKIMNEIKKRITLESKHQKITRIYDEEPEEICEKMKEIKMEISQPLFTMAYKVKMDEENMVKKDIAIEILCNIIIGDSSKLYKRLYEDDIMASEFNFNFEYARNYAHVIISGRAKEPEKVINEAKNEFEFFINQGISDEDFDRIKKKVYGEYVTGYNSIDTIGNAALLNFYKGINLFEFFEVFDTITKEYLEDVLKEVFREDRKVLSIVRGI